jgi:hypothetical protein
MFYFLLEGYETGNNSYFIIKAMGALINIKDLQKYLKSINDKIEELESSYKCKF